MKTPGPESHKEIIPFDRYVALSKVASEITGSSVRVAAHEGRPYEHEDVTARAGNLHFSYASIRPKTPLTVPEGHVYAEITAPDGNTAELNRLADQLQKDQTS
jgi:hypothetical protein